MTTKKKTIENETTLSKAELFYIENNCSSKSLDVIAEDLEVQKEDVKKVYDEYLLKAQALNNRSDKLMKIDSKRGYAVMTVEASSKNEAARKRTSNTNTNHIHKIRQDG